MLIYSLSLFSYSEMLGLSPTGPQKAGLSKGEKGEKPEGGKGKKGRKGGGGGEGGVK